MDRPNTVSGLLDKRAELAGLLKFHRAEIRKITCDLDHIDAAIRIFDPNADITRVSRIPPKHHAGRGDMQKFVLKAFREATAPITSVEIARAWIKNRQLDADAQTVVLIRSRIGSSLSKLRRDGIIREVGQTGAFKSWELLR